MTNSKLDAAALLAELRELSRDTWAARLQAEGPADELVVALGDEAERLALVEVSQAVEASEFVVQVADQIGAAGAKLASLHPLGEMGHYDEALRTGKHPRTAPSETASCRTTSSDRASDTCIREKTMNTLKRLLILLTCVAPTGLALGQHCDPPAGPWEDPFVPGRAMVRVADPWDIGAFLQMLSNELPQYVGTTVNGAIESRKTYRLQLPPGIDECLVESDLLFFVSLGVLDWGEANYVGEAAEGKTGSIYVSRPASAAAQYRSQYAMSVLGYDQAHLLSTGRGVVVAVLDTGVDATHPELQGHVLSRGFNFINNTPDTRDIGSGSMVGHGTFMAGLIALTAPDAKILPVVVLNSDGIGDTLQLAAGVYYAIDQGAEIINLSLGSTYKMEALEDAVKEAESLGIAVVGSAGNFHQDIDEEYPASFEEEDQAIAIGVAGTDRDLAEKWADSTFNEYVSISAPATSLGFPQAPDPNWSIYGTIPDEQFAIWEGTSLSAAFVSGAAALVRAQYPEWPYAPGTFTDLLETLKTGAVPIPHTGMGAGRINVEAATSAGPAQPTPGDLNNDGTVGLADLGWLLADWGMVHSSADLDASGMVDLADLGILLANFGL